MNKKDRTKPRKLYFNNAILGRIRPNHPVVPDIEEDNRRREAGYTGEKKLDLLLNRFPEKDYHVYQGLHLPNEDGTYFQIDSFMVSPSHIIDIEVKNMTSELTIDRKSGQMIQSWDNKQNVYEDPLLQAELQLRQFNDWLRRHQFPNIPLEPLVMMSNSNCILKIVNDPEAQYRICRGRQVLYRIDDFSLKHNKGILTPPLIKKLNRLLLKEDFEPSFDIEKIYKISRSELLNGVHCPDCRYLGMIYYQGYWLCPRCQCKSRDAFLPALRDYFLLYGPEITNQQFRGFLGIDSINVASKMLHNLDLPHTEATKNRIYQLFFDIY